MQLNDFTLEDQQGYLVVDGTQPGASDRVRRWRAHCRKHRKHSISAMKNGSQFHLEIRWPDWWPAGPEMETFKPLKYRGAGSQATSMTFNDLRCENFSELLDFTTWTMDSFRCEELRIARQNPSPALPPPPEVAYGECIVGTRFSRSFYEEHGPKAPRVLLRLPEIEYQILDCGLQHIFGAFPGPVMVEGVAGTGPHRYSVPRLRQQLSNSSESGLADIWHAALGPYHWEERFPSSNVRLASSERSVSITRPAIAGQEAAFWASGQMLAGSFRGFVRLTLINGNWSVTELSFDDDWVDTPLEERNEFEFHWQRPSIDSNWKLVPLEFPQKEAHWVSPEQIPISQRVYKDLLAGSADPALLDLPMFPTFRGPVLSARQLLAVARERKEVLWEIREREIRPLLKELGQVVLDTGDLPDSCWRFLAHLQDELAFRQVSQSFLIPTEILEPYSSGVADLLDRIFERAGCLGLRFKPFEQYQFAFQEAGSGLARYQVEGCIFESQGVIWGTIERRGFGSGIYALLGELCEWGDPEKIWLKRLWRAAVIESARPKGD